MLGLDAKAGKAAVSGWEEDSGRDALTIAREVSDWPLAAIVYTGRGHRRHTRGAELDATAELVAATGPAGGLLRRGRHAGRPQERWPSSTCRGAIVGRALYEDRFTIAEAVAAYEGGQGDA